MSDLLIGLGTGHAPLVAPLASTVPSNPFRYRAYDLMSGIEYGDLPLASVNFTRTINGAGALTGTFNAQDPKVRALDIWDATRPARTALFVDFDGVIVWAGIIWDRPDSDPTRTAVPIQAQEMWSYFSRRMLALDYTIPPSGAFWSGNPASAPGVALQLIWDAAQKVGSPFRAGLPFAMTFPSAPAGAPASLSPSYPATQPQTVESLVTQLAASGYGTGFDFTIRGAYDVNGKPTLTFEVGFPLLGHPPATTQLTLHTTDAAAYAFPESGSSAANTAYVTGSAAGGTILTTAASAAPLDAGYPLLEDAACYVNISDMASLQAAAANELHLSAYPSVVPTVTGDALGDPVLGTYAVGDTARWIIEPDERFSSGADAIWRIVSEKVDVANHGRVLIHRTLNMPPSVGPAVPPI